MLNILQFPIFLVELYYLPVLYLWRKKNVISSHLKIEKNILLLCAVLWVSSMVSIVLYGPYAITEYRAIIYMLFVYGLYKGNYVQISLTQLYYLSMGIIFGEGIYVLFVKTGSTTSSLNMLAIAVFLISALMLKKYYMLILGAAWVAVYAISSGYRMSVIAFAISVATLLIYLWLSRSVRRNVVKVFVMLAVSISMFIAAVLFVNNLETIVMWVAEITGMGTFAIFRVTTRLQSLLMLDFETSQDGARFAVFSMIFTEFFESVFPVGIDASRNGNYIDAPMIYLYALFGSVLAWLLVIRNCFVVGKSFLTFCKFGKFRSEASECCLFVMPLVACLLIANGTFIVTTNKAVLLGILLGTLENKNSHF